MYFAALLARTEDGWQASDTELDDVQTLGDLADLARQASEDDETVLVCLEQEGSWFGLVRVDGEDDPRVYVSDAAAATRSSYGELLLTDELLGREPEDLNALVNLDGTEDGTEDDSDLDSAESPMPAGPLGDANLLADLGLTAADIRALDPEDALSEVAEALGCTEMLEAVR
ncbi:hypothetical protein [Streptomyces sp. NPDC005438]|uniref:tRNA adenosine deaminase-associated protein n=1 Tax=Streptomyces sp. NPDC005438 TaxID=3156880 RepID=UPI0033BDDDAF